MRILFICQFFAPDITAAAFRMADSSRLLAEMGDEVRVITTYPHKVQVDHVDDSDFERAGIHVSRCHVPAINGGGARTYLKHYLTFAWKSVILGIRAWRSGWRPDMIYASSPPLFVGLSGWVLARVFRCPMVFEVRDIWPDAAVSAGQLTADSRAYRLGQWLEKFLYKRASHITCVAAPMKDYLKRHCQVPVTVVYNGVSSEIIEIETETPEVQPAGPQTILYAGNMGHVQQTDLLLKGFAHLVHESALSDWQIKLLGAGAQLENLKSLSRKLNISELVHFSDAVSRQEAARQMRGADILFLHLMGDSTMEQTIPSKLFDYLLAARPILGGIAGEGQMILESTAANIVFRPGDVEQFKPALLDATRRWAELNTAAPENRQLVLNRFTRQKAARELQEVFKSLLETDR